MTPGAVGDGSDYRMVMRKEVERRGGWTLWVVERNGGGDGDGGGGGDVVDGRRMMKGRVEGECRGRGGSLWRIGGRVRRLLVLAVLAVVGGKGEIVGMLLIVAVVVWVVVPVGVGMIQGNSGLESLLGRADGNGVRSRKTRLRKLDPARADLAVAIIVNSISWSEEGGVLSSTLNLD